MDAVYKTFKAEVKGIEEDGTVDLFIPLSDASVDRDGEVIEPAAFTKTIESFMKHPVLVSSHTYSDLRKQIGHWKDLKLTAKGLKGKPQYYIGKGNDEADWGHFLATKGVAAFSIGFMPIKWRDGQKEKDPRRVYEEIELLEVSQVIIPSNREAIQSMRGKSAVVDEMCDKVLELVPIVQNVTITSDCEVIPGVVCETASVKAISEADIQDDFDEIVTYFESGGKLTKDGFKYAWRIVNSVLGQAQGDIPDDIRNQFQIPQVDIVEAVKTAFTQILGGKDA